MRFIGYMFILSVEAGIIAGFLRSEGSTDQTAAFGYGMAVGVTVLELTGIFLLLVIVHELGHLIAGHRAGLTFRSFAVGPLQLSKSNGRMHFHVLKQSPVAGMVIMTVKSEDMANVARFRSFIAGGPLASILATVVLIGVLYAIGGSLNPGTDPALLRYAAYVSIYILTGTLIPYTTRTGYATDMRLIGRMSRDGPMSKATFALLMMSREIFTGMRAREWTPTLIQALLVEGLDDDMRLRGLTFAYYHAFDCGEIEQAHTYIGQALALVRPLKREHILKNLVLYEAAYVAAWLDKDPEAAQELLSQAWDKHETLAGTRHIALAALALGRRDPDRAKTELAVAERRLRDLGKRMGSSIEFGLGRLASMKSACDEFGPPHEESTEDSLNAHPN